MGQDPDQLRRDIERTRQELTYDVDALAEKTSPSRVAHRQVDKAKSGLTRVKETVMGSAHDATSSTSSSMHSAAGSVSGTASNAASGVGSAASSAREGVGSAATSAREGVSSAAGSVAATATSVVETGKQQAKGNPLAAGLIAFGAGWLVSSLLPATQKERQLAQKGLDQAQQVKQPVMEKAKELASEIKEEVAPQAQDAVQSVKSTAQDAAGTVKEEATSATQQVKGEAQSSAQQVKDQTQSASSSGGSTGGQHAADRPVDYPPTSGTGYTAPGGPPPTGGERR